MTNLKKISSTLTSAAISATLIMNFAACTSQNPVSQETKKLGKLAEATSGTIRLLQVDAAKQMTLMKPGHQKGPKGPKDPLFYQQKDIKANRGGELKVGNRKVGESKIKFKKNDLPQDLTISFQWAPAGTFEGLLSNMEFGPHGTYFNNPVELELSYKTANLEGFDEEDLRVYYYNEESELWKFIGGDVNKRKKTVKVYLDHFSRYAIGAE